MSLRLLTDTAGFCFRICHEIEKRPGTFAFCRELTAMNKLIGLTDSPAGEDEFGIGHYITGLSQFILNCDTPMTISIQGSWGSGKTSIMKMVQRRIEDKVLPVFFNTWQFSQFDLGNALPISMIKFFLEEIGAQEDRLYKALSFMGSMSAMVANAAVRTVSGGLLENPFGKNEGSGNNDLARTIKELHDNLQKHIETACAKTKKDRIVVFVDDLDRLVPSKAMELLEVLKIFLDCRNCVFVLAIDYDVVIRGAAEKYGFKINDKTPEGLKEAEKGRAFFDKIIQVPFKMPVVEYDISKYMEEGLKKINITPNEDDMEIYQKLCAYSVGTNPRGLKRILNAFLLLNTMRAAKAENMEDSKQQLILFGLLCLQQHKEGIYNLIVRVNRNIDEDDPTEAFELFTRLLNDENAAEHINEDYRTDIQQIDIQNFRHFLDVFLELIEIKPLDFLLDEDFEEPDEEQQKLIDANSERYQLFNQILTLSASTASDSDASQVEVRSDKKKNKVLGGNEFIFQTAAKLNKDPEYNRYYTVINDKDVKGSYIGNSLKCCGDDKHICAPWTYRHVKAIIQHFCLRNDLYLSLYDKRQEIEEQLGITFKWDKPDSKKELNVFKIRIRDNNFEDPQECEQLYKQMLDNYIKVGRFLEDVLQKAHVTSEP